MIERYDVSRTKACKIISSSRGRFYYERRMPSKDLKIKEAIESVMGMTRKGRNKIIRMVLKVHPELTASKIRRVYVKERFSLPQRCRKRMKDNPANPIMIPLERNEEWAIDFMSDALSNRRRFRTFNVVDHFNRAALGILTAHSIPARRTTDFLDRMIEKYGKPKRIRGDNGPEMMSKWFRLWLVKRGITWSAIQKGSPQENAIVERFNRTYREDVLDANVFHVVQNAQDITDRWLVEYNTVREHEALDYQTPAAYAA
ncbi:integrase core domain-containing protein [Chryseolinea sp. T2]|uniref:integrase core domain-containing protein n=1 Tax=Chryseolinea sp. T2 TaxID=3129255 RepID=UPI0030778FF2